MLEQLELGFGKLKPPVTKPIENIDTVPLDDWNVPIVPEGDPLQTCKEITKVIENNYIYFDGWHNSFEKILDVVLAFLSNDEDHYLETVKGLDPKALNATSEIFALLLTGFCVNYNIWDYLGVVYQEVASRSKSKAFGQFFTPMHLTEMMAKMSLGDVKERIAIVRASGKKENIDDPCVGSGAMLLGCKRHIISEAGLNGVRYFGFYGVDKDPICVKMAKIQMTMTDFRYMCDFMIIKTHELQQHYKKTG